MITATFPKEEIPCITEDYLRKCKSAFTFCGYNEIFVNAPRYSTNETLTFKPKK